LSTFGEKRKKKRIREERCDCVHATHKGKMTEAKKKKKSEEEEDICEICL